MKTIYLTKREIIGFLALLFVVSGCCLITYGITRWQTTSHVLEGCRSRVSKIYVSEGVMAKVVNGKNEFTLKDIEDIIAHVYKSISNSQGLHDWLEGAMVCSFFGLSAIAIGCYFNGKR